MTNSTQQEKEKKLCWFGLLVSAGKAFLPKCIKTSQGDFDVEPIREVNYRDRADLVDALRQAIEIGNPPGEVPEYQLNKQRTPTEKLIGAKSWADLERKTIYFSIMVYPSDIRIESWGRAPNGRWSGEKETVLDARISAEKGPEGIADVILDHLKTRTDLPGVAASS